MKTVLVVEDDKEIRDLVARGLKGRYRVIEAVDGMAAAELFGSIDPPDLMICDIMMPRVDGITLVAMMKKNVNLKSVPIIFLTAKSAPADIIRGIGLGARHYLPKPFSMKDLLEKVAKIVGD